MTVAHKFATVDEYMAALPDDVRAALADVRATVLAAAPGCDEVISYNIPTLKRDGKAIVYYSGWKQHISVYPIPSGDEAFERAIDPHRAGKGTLKFPLSKSIPRELVARVVQQLDRA